MGEKSVEEKTFDLLKEAFVMFANAVASREGSLVKTKLEEAMMWINRDRTLKGQLAKSETHVQ